MVRAYNSLYFTLLSRFFFKNLFFFMFDSNTTTETKLVNVPAVEYFSKFFRIPPYPVKQQQLSLTVSPAAARNHPNPGIVDFTRLTGYIPQTIIAPTSKGCLI
jgi:hypothetical protein